MSLSDWHLAVKLADQPLAPKSILRLPETELGEYSLGGYSISFLKQLIAGKLQESVPDPELIDLIYCGRKLKDDQTLDFYGIQPGSTVHVLRKSWPEPDQKPEPVDKVAALREFRVLHTALHSSSWGTVELPDLGPSPRASWPLPWPWPALRRAALTHRLLAPRAIPRGPPQCPPVSSQGRPSPMISSAKPYSMPCRPLGNPAFRASGSPSCSSSVTWAFRTMS
uniref:Ubiquitin like 7 n=1 Tax=Rousettus aegyptiacus TaxID=9407 RepID=A0A7J8IUJ1_ROUAE|nr:ubiquitin like 7 [Rousettus aegyptiacus]